MFDVISGQNVALTSILPLLAWGNTKTVTFHYTPSLKENPVQGKKLCGSEVQFVKDLSGTALPPVFMHPITAQAKKGRGKLLLMEEGLWGLAIEYRRMDFLY
ncbi:hypothetical protein [Peribacillus sp. SCS-37]|uniref:hypothetical protein n=1 Tax=Paraperibacillus esterisolvens TaxID=3115296 RepID=UPI003905E6FF